MVRGIAALKHLNTLRTPEIRKVVAFKAVVKGARIEGTVRLVITSETHEKHGYGDSINNTGDPFNETSEYSKNPRDPKSWHVQGGCERCQNRGDRPPRHHTGMTSRHGHCG